MNKEVIDLEKELTHFRGNMPEQNAARHAELRVGLASQLAQGRKQNMFGWRSIITWPRVAWGAGALAAGIASVMAFGLLPISVSDNGGIGGIGSSAHAAQVLREAAVNAQEMPSAVVRDDQFVYTRSYTTQLVTRRIILNKDGKVIDNGENPSKEGNPYPSDAPGFWVSYYEESLTELWRPVTSVRPTRIKHSTGTKRTPVSSVEDITRAGIDLNEPVVVREVEEDMMVDLQSHAESLSLPNDLSNPFVNPTPTTLATLPVEPRKLLDTVHDLLRKGESEYGKRSEEIFNGLTFQCLMSLAREGAALMQPELRSALFKAAALVPGVTSTKDATDFSGHKGETVGWTHSEDRTEFLIDPATSQVFAERIVRIEGGPDGDSPKKGAVTWEARMDSVVVDSEEATS